MCRKNLLSRHINGIFAEYMSQKKKYNKEEIAAQLEVIQTTLQQFPNGASIEELMDATAIPIGIRTFQRRLEQLRDQVKITISGDTRSTRYHLLNQTTTSAETPDNQTQESIDKGQTNVRQQLIKISAESEEILKLVSLPENVRIPVGYRRQFLESYRPNVDSYLTREDKQKLAELGNTSRSNQPAGTYAREILGRLLIDLSWNSSRMEGNTYSLLDTQKLISDGQTANNKSAMEAQMILNHKDAIEFLVEDTEDIGFNRYTILNLHALLSNNLLPDPAASGRLRQHGVGINSSVYTPLVIPKLIEEMFELLLAKASRIEDPFEQAFFVMVHLPYLQPFDDVNKRVSRLAANIPLNRHNLAPLSFIDVPNDIYIKGLLGVYELNRMELLKEVFIWAYERSCMKYAAVRQTIGEPDPFRLKYRNNIRSVVTEIVSQALSIREASPKIDAEAVKLPTEDRQKFIEAVETELMSLHEGNFARYMVRPAEFKAWKIVWET